MIDQSTPTLDDVVGKLLVESGIAETVDEDVLQEIGNDLKHRLETRINAMIVEHLPPDQLEAFTALTVGNAPDPEVQAFVQAHIPNLPELVAGTILAFKHEYLTRGGNG